MRRPITIFAIILFLAVAALAAACLVLEPAVTLGGRPVQPLTTLIAAGIVLVLALLLAIGLWLELSRQNAPESAGADSEPEADTEAETREGTRSITRGKPAHDGWIDPATGQRRPSNYFVFSSRGPTASAVRSAAEKYGRITVGYDAGALPNLQDSLRTAKAVDAELEIYVEGPGGVTGNTGWLPDELARVKKAAQSVGIDIGKSDWMKKEWNKWGWKEYTFRQLESYMKQGFSAGEIDNLYNGLGESPEHYVAFYKEYAARHAQGRLPRLVLKNHDVDMLRRVVKAVKSGELPREMFSEWHIFETKKGNLAKAEDRIGSEIGIRTVVSWDTYNYAAKGEYKLEKQFAQFMPAKPRPPVQTAEAKPSAPQTAPAQPTPAQAQPEQPAPVQATAAQPASAAPPQPAPQPLPPQSAPTTPVTPAAAIAPAATIATAPASPSSSASESTAASATGDASPAVMEALNALRDLPTLADEDVLRGLPPMPDDDEAFRSVIRRSAPVKPTDVVKLEIEQDGNRYYATDQHGNRCYVGKAMSYAIQNARGLGLYDKRYKYDRFDEEKRTGVWAHFIWPSVMAESEGMQIVINTWDRAHFTWGFYQLAAHTADENLIVLFRELLKLPTARFYFPELTLHEGRVARIAENGPVTLERAVLDQRRNELQIPDFMRYMNPSIEKVDPPEALNCARFVHWAEHDPDMLATTTRVSIETMKKKLARLDKMFGLTGRRPEVALWVSDMYHQGRAVKDQVAEALALPTLSRQLQALSEIDRTGKYSSRCDTVRRHVKTLIEEKRFEGMEFGKGPFSLTAPAAAPAAASEPPANPQPAAPKPPVTIQTTSQAEAPAPQPPATPAPPAAATAASPPAPAPAPEGAAPAPAPTTDPPAAQPPQTPSAPPKPEAAIS